MKDEATRPAEAPAPYVLLDPLPPDVDPDAFLQTQADACAMWACEKHFALRRGVVGFGYDHDGDDHDGDGHDGDVHDGMFYFDNIPNAERPERLRMLRAKLVKLGIRIQAEGGYDLIEGTDQPYTLAWILDAEKEDEKRVVNAVREIMEGVECGSS